MVDIRPFKGYSYAPSSVSDLSSVVAPPYDVITDQERKNFSYKSPLNFIHITLPANYESGRADPDFYEQAASQWISFKTNHTVEQSDSPNIWCLKETYDKNDGQPVTRFGFITELSLEGESDRFVLRHEKTHRAPQMDRMKLYEATRANLSPLFFIYQDDPNETKNFLEHFKTSESRRAELDHHGKVSLEFSSMDDEVWIQNFCQSFKDKYVLIADGLHRYEASRIFHKKNIDEAIDSSAVMAYIVPASSPGLIVHATHRAVHGLADFDETEFLKSLKNRFTFDAPQNGSHQIEVVTPAKGRFTVTPNEQTLEHLRKLHNSLDSSDLTVVILEEIVLREILGLSQSQKSSIGNLKYFQNSDSAFDSVNSGEWDVAFLLDPVSLNDLFSVT